MPVLDLRTFAPGAPPRLKKKALRNLMGYVPKNQFVQASDVAPDDEGVPVGPQPPASPRIANAGRERSQRMAEAFRSAFVAAPEVGDGDPDAYRRAYQEALAASQANIEAQYRAALAEIAQREAMAMQAVDTLPAQYAAVYDSAQKAVEQASNAIYAAQQNSGLTPFLPAGAEAAPIQAALSGALASNQAGVPLLRLGVSGEVSRMRQALDVEKANALADLAAQRAQYEANLQEMLLRRQWDVQDQQLAFEREQQQKKQEQRRAWGLREVNVDRGGELAFLDPDRANAIRNGLAGKASHAFRTALNDLVRNPPAGKSGRVKQALVMARIKEYMRRWPHQAEAISLALFDSGIVGQIEA